MTGKNLKTIIQQMHLMCYINMLKKRIYILPRFQNTVQILKTNHSFNDSKWRRMALSSSKKLSASLTRVTSKHDGDFFM